jgi:hypothetical protein
VNWSYLIWLAITKCLVPEPEGSTLALPKSAIKHVSEPVSSNSFFKITAVLSSHLLFGLPDGYFHRFFHSNLVFFPIINSCPAHGTFHHGSTAVRGVALCTSEDTQAQDNGLCFFLAERLRLIFQTVCQSLRVSQSDLVLSYPNASYPFHTNASYPSILMDPIFPILIHSMGRQLFRYSRPLKTLTVL